MRATRKLKPVVCDIDAFTVQNLFEYSRGLPPDQTIALINVGASLSSLNIIANGVSAFTREIANGGNVITEEIQKQLSVPFDQAEAYKCGGAADPDDPYRGGMVPQQVVQVIDAVTDAIAAEIQRSLDFFMATSGEGEIARIYVTGGTAALAPLAAAIERRARVPVEVWLPTERVMVEVARRRRRSARAARRAALGRARARLAQGTRGARVIRINLLPQKRRVERRDGGQPALARGRADVVPGRGGRAVRVSRLQERGAARAAAQERRAPGADRSGEESRRRTTARSSRSSSSCALKEDAIAKLQSARTGPTAVLLELARIMTPGRGPSVDPERLNQLRRDNPLAVFNPSWDARRLWLTKFVEQQRKVRLEGVARDGEDVSELARRLQLSSLFHDVRLLPAKKQRDAKTGLDLVTFQLEAKVRY